MKLADRLHSMQTARFLPQAKQLRKARESLDIFVPVGEQLSMPTVTSELEALASATLTRHQVAGRGVLTLPGLALTPRRPQAYQRTVAVLDIERSTSRPDPVKAKLRKTMYALFDAALRAAGINPRDRDRFADRGDGLLAIIHDADHAPRILLKRVIPAFGLLLAEYNAGLPPLSQLRVRVVVHAGTVFYDANGCFGETLDTAFRLLDAPGVKEVLRSAQAPLVLVVFAGLDGFVHTGQSGRAFPRVSVQVAGNEHEGRVSLLLGDTPTCPVNIGSMDPVDLAHDDAGDGPVVVLIHGHPFNRGMWAPQLAVLRDRFRVIAPDLRGYGDSPVTPGTVPMAQLAADVGHLLDRKGVATAALVGLSMGGLVVMELAAAQPERWWAYGFIATTAQRVTEQERAARLDSARTMDEQGMRPVAEQMAARLFGPGPSEELAQTIMTMMLATDPAGAAAAVRGRAERPDYQPVLKALRAPALVCAGDHDSYSTAEITTELAGCLPGPDVVVMEGVGHLPNLERPDAFNAHLLRFLTRALP